MRLLNFVEENNGIGAAANLFRELSTFFIAYIAWGRTIMRATECFSMYSDMSRRMMAFSSSNKNSARARASSVCLLQLGRGTG